MYPGLIYITQPLITFIIASYVGKFMPKVKDTPRQILFGIFPPPLFRARVFAPCPMVKSELKGIVQRDLTGVETSLKRSVMMN